MIFTILRLLYQKLITNLAKWFLLPYLQKVRFSRLVRLLVSKALFYDEIFNRDRTRNHIKHRAALDVPTYKFHILDYFIFCYGRIFPKRYKFIRWGCEEVFFDKINNDYIDFLETLDLLEKSIPSKINQTNIEWDKIKKLIRNSNFHNLKEIHKKHKYSYPKSRIICT